MIEKGLLIILVFVLALGVWNSFSTGVSLRIPIIGAEIKTKSYTTLIDNSRKLATNKNDLNTKNEQEYPDARRRLETQKNKFRSSKKEYEDLAAQASADEIRSVNQKKEYMLDFIFTRIGTYALDDDVNVKIDPKYDEAKINFDVSGPYVAVINFIYDLERDDDLSLNVNNLVMQGGSSDSVTRASFFVSNISVVTSETRS